MAERYGTLGGFVALNTEEGCIKDSYTVMNINGKRMTSGGFVGENKGSIKTSYCAGKSIGAMGGFAGKKMQFEKGCFFLYANKAKAKRFFWDEKLYVEKHDLSDEGYAKELGFEMEKAWTYTGRKAPLQFQDQNWFVEAETGAGKKGKGKVLQIHDAKDLFKFATMVNRGDEKAMEAQVVLLNDIDMGKEEWFPIGETRARAFAGSFDGQGHTIRNFVVKDKDSHNKGLFGFLKGSLYNLNIDCQIKGSGVLGPMVAVNEGLISCCGVCADIYVKNAEAESKVGGFVGSNCGTIERCYAAGHIHFAEIPVAPIFVIFASILVLAAGINAGLPAVMNDNIYKKIARDPNQTEIDDEDKNKDNSSDESEVSDNSGNRFSFRMSQKVTIKRAEGKAYTDFANPSDSNHSLVVEICITDATAKSIMGGTGRSEEEQRLLESKTSYDPETSMVVLGSSLSIDPGYQLNAVNLTTYAIEHLPSGTYEGYLCMTPYSVSNYNKGMINSSMPIIITVE